GHTAGDAKVLGHHQGSNARDPQPVRRSRLAQSADITGKAIDLPCLDFILTVLIENAHEMMLAFIERNLTAVQVAPALLLNPFDPLMAVGLHLGDPAQVAPKRVDQLALHLLFEERSEERMLLNVEVDVQLIGGREPARSRGRVAGRLRLSIHRQSQHCQNGKNHADVHDGDLYILSLSKSAKKSGYVLATQVGFTIRIPGTRSPRRARLMAIR